MPHVNVTLVNHEGAVEISTTSSAAQFWNGTAHDAAGRMLVAHDSEAPGPVHAGIRHTNGGLRCISEGAVAAYTAEGFALDDTGAQVITWEAPTRRIAGLGVDDEGRLSVRES